MDIKDCNRTKGGHPWRFYADDGGGRFPIHGAWQDIHGSTWHPGRWAINGQYSVDNNSHLNLDLTDWRDQIPWGHIVDEVIFVAREDGFWRGYFKEPAYCGRYWSYPELSYSLQGVKGMPNGPTEDREAIARRPDTARTG